MNFSRRISSNYYRTRFPNDDGPSCRSLHPIYYMEYFRIGNVHVPDEYVYVEPLSSGIYINGAQYSQTHLEGTTLWHPL